MPLALGGYGDRRRDRSEGTIRNGACWPIKVPLRLPDQSRLRWTPFCSVAEKCKGEGAGHGDPAHQGQAEKTHSGTPHTKGRQTGHTQRK